MNFNVLGEPFPFNSSLKKDFISALLFGLFIFLFLLIFQPFGLSNYQSNEKTMELAGYGMVTSILLFSNNLFFTVFFPRWYSKTSWTVGKNIIYTTYIFFIIGFGNLVYSIFIDYLGFSIKGLLFYQAWTLLIGLFPVTISTFVVYNKRLKNAICEAETLNLSLPQNTIQSHDVVEIPSQNKSENLQIDVYSLLCVKAVENYVEVYSLNDGTMKKAILRNTLKNIEIALSEFKTIKKCHRSYLVNLKNVDHFSGNAQGLSLHFGPDLNLEVIVSRAYVKKIKTHLTI